MELIRIAKSSRSASNKDLGLGFDPLEIEGKKVIDNRALERGVDASVIGEDQSEVQMLSGADEVERAHEIAHPPAPFAALGSRERPDLGTAEGIQRYAQILSGRGITDPTQQGRFIKRMLDQGIVDPIGFEQEQSDFGINRDVGDDRVMRRDFRGNVGELLTEFNGQESPYGYWKPGPGAAEGKQDWVPAKKWERGAVQVRNKAKDMRRRVPQAGGGKFLDPIAAISAGIKDGSIQLDMPIEAANAVIQPHSKINQEVKMRGTETCG